MVLSNRSRLVTSTALALCAVLHSASAQESGPALGSDLICGPDHALQVRRVMIARNPNAAATAARPTENELRFNRGLIIRDFVRLRAERSAELPEAVRRIDPGALRRDGDRGRLTGDACAVVQFMSEYFGAPAQSLTGAPTYLRADDPAAARVEAARAGEPGVAAPLPSVSSQPVPPRPRPDRLASLAVVESAPVAPAEVAETPELIPDAAQTTAFSEVGTAPGAQPASIPTPDVAVRPVALRLLTEIAAQVEVPPFLSFREERIRSGRMSEEEIKQRREASLLATERIASVLTTLQMVPELRADVQLLLGRDGRARLEAGILRTFENVPDRQQRERVLQLWTELEAQALEKR